MLVLILVSDQLVWRPLLAWADKFKMDRTGRAGNGGVAISFCSHDEEGYWRDIKKLIKVDVNVISDHPYPWQTGTSPDVVKEVPKNSNRSGEKFNSRKSEASKQNKKRWY